MRRNKFSELGKVLIIWIFTSTARLLFRTLESIATPCSVNTYGNFRVPPHLDIPKWNFKFLNSSIVS
jgi:hypothetical protein